MRSRILFALLIQIIISVAGAWQLPEVSAQPTPTELKELSIFFRRPSALQLLLNRLFPTDTINPSFAWARLPRYGLDKNRNDIIDLPNSFDYAHNLPSWDRSGCECFQGDCSNGGAQFRVMFDASGTFFPPTSARTDNPAVILPGNPWHTAEEAAFHAGRLQARMRQLEWRIEGEPLRQAMTGNIQYAPPYTYETCLPEGTYTVTLRALDNYTNEWRDFQRSVSVEDILIVQLGDSYGSGEGNPEKVIRATVRVGNDSYEARAEAMLHAMHHPNVQYVLWADDGQPQEWIETEASALLSLGQTPVLARMTARVPNFERFSEIHRDHYRSHRSSFTASSQLAIELENDNKKSSVTYINLAMSGATTNDGVLGSYAGVPVARFYGNYMGNQLKQLQDIVGNRRIDMLIMSIGGNDAGFAHSAAGLVAREESYGPGGAHFGVNFEKISRGVRTGKWAEVEDSTGFLRGT